MQPTPGDRLARALDTTTLVWKTGGSASWFDYTLLPFNWFPAINGGIAAASGQISHNQESWVETEVPTSGTLVFSWAVSSQVNRDKLSFLVGGAPAASISGDIWWDREIFDVPSGPLRWVYAKDADGAQGQDRGFLDWVVFYPSKPGAAPEIVIAPVSTGVNVGVDAVLSVGVTGEAPFTYQWYKNGVPIEGATQSRLNVREATSSDAGSYHVTVKNRVGSVASNPVTLNVSTFWLDLALDHVGGALAWATGGDKPWFAFTIDPTAHDGRDMAGSGVISHNQESWIEKMVTGPVLVNFWWKVSSESDADFLRFQVGDVERAKISGEVNWREESFELSPGTHRLRWRYTKSASGSAGQDRGWLDQVAFKLTPQQSMGLALDATNLVWRTGGNASWFDFTQWTAAELPPFDGRWAARSGPITHGQQSWLETDISGPGTLAFWWAVSSQTNADSLRFSIAGAERASISGTRNWQLEVFSVPAGSHVVRWEYSKDGSLSQGLDRALLDRVVFVPTVENGPPAILHSPQTQTVIAGSDASFAVIALGAEPLRYQWYLYSAPIPGATNSTLVLPRVSYLNSGPYRVEVRNAAGVMRSGEGYLVVIPSPLATAVDASTLLWATGGNASWFVSSTSPDAYNFNAAGSGYIADNQTSWIDTQVTGPAVVQFKWRVSSEQNADFLRFYSDNVEVARISGEVSWRQEAFVLPAGQHVLRWEYSKNSAGKSGEDRGWLDQVVLTSGNPVIARAPENQSVLPGESVAFSVVAEGFPPLSYQWLKNGIGIPGATNSTLALGNTQNAEPGFYSVTVKNALGSLTTPSVTWGLAPTILLGGALDIPNLVWTTGGNSSWFGFTRGTYPVAYDGFDAVRSGSISDGQESWIQTSVTGPATVRFAWKVSSEKDADFLRLFVGGAEVARISGEVDWRRESVTVADGEQVLRWQYSKNSTASAGLDRAWLDWIEVLPLPKLATAPQNRTVWEGATVTFNVVPVWNSWFACQWLKDGKVIVGETNDYLRLTVVSPRDVGKYSVMVTTQPVTFTTAPAELIVQPPPDRFLQIIAGTPVAAFMMKTTSGQRYVLEAKDSWNATDWQAVESFVGDGTTQAFKDPRPTARSRFYRVRFE